MRKPATNNNIERLLILLNAASAVTVDHGAMLTDFETEPVTGDPNNPVVRFTWTDGERNYSDILTEGCIAKGMFDSEGRFIAKNSEGENSVVSFFAIKPLSTTSGKCAAAIFFQELLRSVETLSGIADKHGSETLADLMYLLNAILIGGVIDHYPDESNVLGIVRALPSGELWSKFIKTEYPASPS